jgi:hypothetical protein
VPFVQTLKWITEQSCTDDVGRSKMLRCTIMIEEREWLPVVTYRRTYVIWHCWDPGTARKLLLAPSAGQHSR